MPRIVTIRRPTREQYVLYLSQRVLEEAKLLPGDDLEVVVVGKGQFTLRKVK